MTSKTSKPLIVVAPSSPYGVPDAFRFDGTTESIRRLEERVKRKQPRWLLFEKNEQQGAWPIAALNRRLATGYASFSGIDGESQTELEAQTAACWSDWQAFQKGRPVRLALKTDAKTAAKTMAKPRRPGRQSGTFSLVLDTEQLGGVRFGVPRILQLLHGKKVRATFFVTGVVASVYPDLVPTLRAAGHEVGIHGAWHEPLENGNENGQKEQIRRASAPLGAPLKGANFIGRMDKHTPEVLKSQGVRYFVFPMKNNRDVWAAYCPPLWVEPGLWAVPVFAETYGKPWEKIRRELDRTVGMAEKSGLEKHVSVLGHPFFDGSRSRVPVLERVIDHLQANGLQGVPVAESLPSEPVRIGPASLSLKPYGTAGWKGAVERLKNGHALRIHARLLKEGQRPRVRCV